MNAPEAAPPSGPVLDHVAFLVPRIEPVAERLIALGLAAEAVAEFPSEGTREQYLGDPARPGRVLLLQPLAPGPYERALTKRGPGLHHFALQVPDLDAYAAGLRGWLLHPKSLTSRASAGTLWLARPGVAALVEVFAGDGPQSGAPQVGLGVGGALERTARGALIEALGDVPGLSCAETEAWLEYGGARVSLCDLLGLG